MQSVLKNTVTILLIAIFLLSPVSSAYAQVGQAGYNSIGSYSYGGGGTSGGLTTYIKGLGPAITQLPLCKKKIQSGVKSLFTKSKALIAKDATGSLNSTLSESLSEQASASQSIQVESKTLNKEVKKVKAAAKGAESAVKSIDENDTCLKSIGRMVVKMMLQKITLSTVQWIQSGFDGGPAFVQNPGKFMNDIAKEEILQFGIELNLNADCQATLSGSAFGASGNSDCVSPYAKSWVKGQAEAFNKKFSDNAKYSLNELISETTPQYTGASFKSDFSAGGWNAWSALTSVPANNPVGFGLIAEKELSKRLEGTSKSVATEIQEALNQANGFLGDYRCADPEGLTRDQHKAGLEAGQVDQICKRWEYVTPGTVVAEAATKIVNYQDNNLLKAEDLNDAVAAIIDALIQRFSSELFENGLASFSDEGSDGGLIINSYATTGNYSVTQVEVDYPEYLQGSDWFSQYPNFNLRTDLTQAIIDEQRTYTEKLEDQNEVLERVIQWTKQLDYCIPGPSPRKFRNIPETDVFEGAEEVVSKFPGEQIQEILWSFDITGIFSGIGSAVLEKQHERDIKKKIATQLGLMFDIHVYGAYGYSNKEDRPRINQDQVLNKDDMVSLGKNVVVSYYEVIHNTYFNGSKSFAPMPLVTTEARVEFEKIEGYEGIVDENEDKIGIMKSVTQRLARIKEEIEDLGPQPDPTDPAYIDYENSMKPFLSEFGRLTNEMVTGDQIAAADKMLKEMEDKEKYVHDDLLTGPGGCEDEMTEIYNTEPEIYSKFYRRQPYGEPIPYLYGDNANKIQKNLLGGVLGNLEPYDPEIRTVWSEETVKNWNPYDGFLYGSVYWNFWVRPYDGGNPTQADGKTQNPPDINAIRQGSCPEFIDVVYFSYPSSDGDKIVDIGGLEPVAGGEVINYGNNDCGVITRRLEKLLGVY